MEKNFLGLSMRNKNNSLGFNEIIGFFRADFDDIPILREKFNEIQELKVIIKDNNDFFDFISISDEQNIEIDKITLKSFSYYLMEGYDSGTIISCGDIGYNAISLD